MHDLRDHLSLKMPANWTLTQESVFAVLDPDFEVCFKHDGSLIIRFKGTSFTGYYVMPWHDTSTLSWPDLDFLFKNSVDQFLRMLILQPEHQLDPADSEALVKSFTKLPPWLATIIETSFQEIVPDLEKWVDHHQRVIDLKQNQLTFAQRVRGALPPFQTRPSKN